MLRNVRTCIAIPKVNLWKNPLRSIQIVIQINKKRLPSNKYLGNVFLDPRVLEICNPRVELHLYALQYLIYFSRWCSGFNDLKNRFTILHKNYISYM